MKVTHEWSLDPGEYMSLDAVLTGNASRYSGEQRVLYLYAGGRHDVYLYGTQQAAQTTLGLARGLVQLAETLPRDEIDDETRHEIGRLGARLLGRMAREDTDGLDQLAEAVRGERWPTVDEVVAEARTFAGGVSCGTTGCTPADPCAACQSLAGANGGEAR